MSQGSHVDSTKTILVSLHTTGIETLLTTLIQRIDLLHNDLQEIRLDMNAHLDRMYKSQLSSGTKQADQQKKQESAWDLVYKKK